MCSFTQTAKLFKIKSNITQAIVFIYRSQGPSCSVAEHKYNVEPFAFIYAFHNPQNVALLQGS